MKKFATTMLLAASLFATGAHADYPDKPVSFIVPWPPGDLEDVLTRIIAKDFQSEYGVSAAVLNKPGGGGGPFPGAMEVANGPPTARSSVRSSSACRWSARKSASTA